MVRASADLARSCPHPMLAIVGKLTCCLELRSSRSVSRSTGSRQVVGEEHLRAWRLHSSHSSGSRPCAIPPARRWRRSRRRFTFSQPDRSPLPWTGTPSACRGTPLGSGSFGPCCFTQPSELGVQRAALVQLVERARRLRGAWLVGLAGVLLPGLRQQVACLPAGRSRSTAGSGGMVLVGLLERLDDADLSHESAAESLLRTVVRPRDAPTRPSRRRPHLAPVPGGPR